MTTNAANSLLKFLEEPSQDTIAILITEQLHRILDTIVSRCQVLPFQPLQPKAIEERLIEQEVSPHYRLLANMTNNIAEAVELSRNDEFAESRAKVIKLYEVLHQRKGHAFSSFRISGCPFSKKTHQEMGLDMLLLIYRDVLSIQIGNEDKLIYQDLFQSIKQHALQFTQQSVTNQILAVLEAKTASFQCECAGINGALGVNVAGGISLYNVGVRFKKREKFIILIRTDLI